MSINRRIVLYICYGKENALDEFRRLTIDGNLENKTKAIRATKGTQEAKMQNPHRGVITKKRSGEAVPALVE